MFKFVTVFLIIAFMLPGPALTDTASAGPRNCDIPPIPAKVGKSDLEALVEGNNDFAIDLYLKMIEDPELRKAGGNLCISPYSISTALAMSWAGARGETQRQMARALHFNLPQERMHPVLARLQRDLMEGADGGGCRLTVANALWVQKGFKILDAYTDLVQKHYKGGLSELDFAKAGEEARRIINSWADERTNHLIQDLIQPGILGPLTMLVLTNAIHFKGEWTYRFDPDQTLPAPFKISPDEEVESFLMFQKGVFKYGEKDGLQVLEMPYKDGDLSMLVLLPREVNGLEDLEKSLSSKALDEWLGPMRPHEVLVHLPRFRMTSAFSLNKFLIDLGMRDAFTGKADFSGITGQSKLFITEVAHKALVEVNEEGTEAAAATAVIKSKGPPPRPRVFRADHPFLYLIRDNRTGGLLFMGRLAHPD